MFTALKRFRFVLFSLALGAAALVSPSPSSAEGALVLTQANCFYIGQGGVYEGLGTLVQTAKGRVNGVCHAQLVAGNPVPEEVRDFLMGSSPDGPLPCDVIVSPSGSAHFSCHSD